MELLIKVGQIIRCLEEDGSTTDKKRQCSFQEQNQIGWVIGKLKGTNTATMGENNPAKRPEVRQKISANLKTSLKFKEYQERRKYASHKETDS